MNDWYLYVDGKNLGLVTDEQREGLAAEHLRGIEFVAVLAPTVMNVRDLRAQTVGGGQLPLFDGV